MMMSEIAAGRPAYAADEERWAAVVGRDGAADGLFVYAVRTTGVYCRPSCASRPPRRENVSFFAGPEAAQAAGYRPCKRCRPAEAEGDPSAAAVRRACALIAEAERPPSLAELAAAVGLSPGHLQRRFSVLVGVSPHRYAARLRDARLAEGLRAGQPVDGAAYDAGFGSSGRVYAGERLGMRPRELRAGAPGQQISYAVAPCALGLALVAATARGICAIELGDDAGGLVDGLRARFPRAELRPGDDAFADQVAAVVALIETPARGLDLPLDVQGTAFQQRVWEALRAIPAGATRSYAQVAAGIGAPGAARAVAGACAANALAVAIPCHRVVGGDGSLSGYRWGVARKRALLEREAEGS